MSTRYLLDTNICIYAINNRPEKVKDRIIQAGEGNCMISSIVASELAFGVTKSNKSSSKSHLIHFLSLFDLVAFDESCIWHYANLRTNLQGSGQTIGSLDMLIAAHALALDATLVSNNTKEFARIPELKLENWV